MIQNKDPKDQKDFITDDAPINNGRFNDEKRLYIVPLYPDEREEDLDEDDWDIDGAYGEGEL